jgi:hypothetical protein
MISYIHTILAAVFFGLYFHNILVVFGINFALLAIIEAIHHRDHE